jgi:predicted nucleic acid-binding protein
MRALIDTNVIIDVIERREKFFDDSYAVLRIAAQGGIEVFIPAGNIADIYYIIRKSKKAAVAREAIASLLQLVGACDTTASDVSSALSLGIGDFEDAILAATARREKAEYIITRNEKDFVNSPVPAISPAEFLARSSHLDDRT